MTVTNEYLPAFKIHPGHVVEMSDTQWLVMKVDEVEQRILILLQCTDGTRTVEIDKTPWSPVAVKAPEG
jgi:hypothetical protein